MAVSSFAADRLTRLRYPEAEDYGAAEHDYTAAPDRGTGWDGCVGEPVTSSENDDGRTAVITGWRIAAPPGIDLTADDRAEWHGVEYSIDGEPLTIGSPSGALDYTLVVLSTAEG